MSFCMVQVRITDILSGLTTGISVVAGITPGTSETGLSLSAAQTALLLGGNDKITGTDAHGGEVRMAGAGNDTVC